MPIVVPKFQLAYYSSHKCANTTVKAMVFDLENGFPFPGFTAEGKHIDVHRFYPTNTRYFSKLTGGGSKFFKFCVVREPVSRILSCYTNKVLKEKHLVRPPALELLDKAGLTSSPSFSEFLASLDGYRKASLMIETHTDPLAKFLGSDAAYYDRVYRMKEIPEIGEHLSALAGRSISVKKMNASDEAKSKVTPSEDDLKLIQSRFASDYDVFGQYF